MSDGAVVQPNRSDLDLLANLLDRVQKLPPGSERSAALREIRGFQKRLATIWLQAATNERQVNYTSPSRTCDD